MYPGLVKKIKGERHVPKILRGKKCTQFKNFSYTGIGAYFILKMGKRVPGSLEMLGDIGLLPNALKCGRKGATGPKPSLLRAPG